ncbi:MAG: hypothetical protein MUF15_25455, partial [Acidobacteria bacterium]|nr:hypothetical protein [Acidobacteriota bacterium]
FKIGEKDGYQKGTNTAAPQIANEWYNKGVNDGYTLGLKKGQSEGFKKGTRFFLEKWWKPSLGLVILLLATVFIFFTIFLLSRKKMKSMAGQTTQIFENFMVSKKMERVLKNNSKKQ